jgi:hypothetical protein
VTAPAGALTASTTAAIRSASVSRRAAWGARHDRAGRGEDRTVVDRASQVVGRAGRRQVQLQDDVHLERLRLLRLERKDAVTAGEAHRP